jgi:hypothetical protein
MTTEKKVNIAHRHLFWLGHDFGRLHINIMNKNIHSAVSHLKALTVDVEGLEEELGLDFSDFKKLVESCEEGLGPLGPRGEDPGDWYDRDHFKQDDLERKIKEAFNPLHHEFFQFQEKVLKQFEKEATK